MNTQIRIEETERQSLTRLLAKAKAEGIKIHRDRADGRYYASSVSSPGASHYVTAYSCDCRGFAAHQRCKYHAALLDALGWLQRNPDPEPACMACHGAGIIEEPRSRWIGGGRSGFRAEWTSSVPCPACRAAGEELAA